MPLKENNTLEPNLHKLLQHHMSNSILRLYSKNLSPSYTLFLELKN